jgi:ribosomal protein S4E
VSRQRHQGRTAPAKEQQHQQPQLAAAGALYGGTTHSQARHTLTRVTLTRHRYALTGKEVKMILMQRLVKVDGKVGDE